MSYDTSLKVVVRGLLVGTLALLFTGSCQNDRHSLTAPGAQNPAHVPSFTTVVSPSGATFTTDKDDYAPGETLLLSGTGWQSNDVLDIHLDEEPQNHEPVDWTISVDQDGNFTDGTYVVQESDAGVTFTITATSRATGETATATFTDAVGSTLDQCKDDTNNDDVKDPCVWINGDINAGISAYHEGDAVAFRIWLDGMDPSSSHTVKIRYDFTKQTIGGVIVLGYDFLTHPDASETATSQRCTDIPGSIGTSAAGCAGMSGPNTIGVPSDPFTFSASLSGVNAALASQAVATREAASAALKQVVIFGGTFTSITGITKVSDPNTSSASQSELTVTFTVGSGSGAACTVAGNKTNCRVNILFGGHLALGTPGPSGWGTGRGASSFPGASISMRLHEVDGSPSGSVNRSIQPAAVIAAKATPSVLTEIHENPNHTAVTSVVAGATVHDKATVVGTPSGPTPTGTVDFSFFNGSNVCGGTPASAGTVTLDGSGVAHPSSDEGPLAAGSYSFKALYNGDGNYNAAESDCEPLTVGGATPTLTTAAFGPVTVGQDIQDVATLSGGFGTLGGMVTFTLYSDAQCQSQVFGPDVQSVSGGAATSGNYTTSATGTYYWIASYSGDANNNPVSTSCGDAGEASVVNKASPTLATTASGPVTVGQDIQDVATLSGGFGTLGGMVTFTLYSDAQCQSQVFGPDVQSVSGGAATSGNYTTSAAGTYYWIASYSGDANNNGASTSCGDAGEASVVNKASPTLATTASGPVTVGQDIHDVATLSGGFGTLGGMVTFTLYSDAQCQSQVFGPDVQSVSGGAATSGNYTTSATGTYYWIASYSGDANNNPVSTSCGDAGEASVVNKASPTLATTASGPVTVGQDIHDVAHLGNGFNATGTISFSVFAPGDASCSSALSPAPTSATVSGGPGDYPSGNFTTSAVGTYRWIAHYSGDANNNAVSTLCADPAEASEVFPRSLVTSSSLCTFDVNADVAGSQFRVILTPDMLSPSVWKLNASNPGQFFYNVFYSGSATRLTVTLPYPFVTQGARPIHVFSSVTSATVDGQTCLTPGTEVGSSATQVTLADYGTSPAVGTSTTTFTVDVPDGFSYVAIHLDYGLKGTTGYSKDGSNNVILAGTSTIVIPDFQGYTFSFTDGLTSSATVQSQNAFKHDPGFAGFVTDGYLNPLVNVRVDIFDPTGALIGSAYSDVDGFYMYQYKYTGKPATFTVRLPRYGLSQQVTLKANGIVLVSFIVERP